MKSAPVAAGDNIIGGTTVLACLETSELDLELTAAKAEFTAFRKQASVALREGQTAEAMIAEAQSEKVAARINLLEYQKQKAKITSDIDGAVVSGELDQRIGAPVKTGEVLLEVAQLESIWVDIALPDDQVADVGADMRGELATTSYPNQKIAFVVERVEPMADVVNQRNIFKVRARLLETPGWMRPGMYVELAVAAVAAIVWANTAEAAVTHAVAYNIMLIAGVSTLLFNGNPLLRYDAYYILSDALEIPNFAQKSQEYARYLIKRYVWGVDSASSPAHLPDERKWLLGYAIASTTYRVFVCAAILLFLIDRFFVIGTILAAIAVFGWLVTPFFRLLRYLVSSSQLARCRGRAISTSLAAFSLVAFGLGVVRVPEYARAEGIVEPRDLAAVHAAVDGLVREVLPSGILVRPNGPALVQAANPELTARFAELQAELREYRLRRQLALDQTEFAAAQAAGEQLVALERKALDAEERLNQLAIHAPFAGTWLAPRFEHVAGVYLRRGDPIGTVASLNDVLVRAFADQSMAAQLFAEACEGVRIRPLNRPESELAGSIEQILPAGAECLPTSALGTSVGGKIEIDPDDPNGVRTAEPIFEIRVRPDAMSNLLPGQRVVVRFRMRDKPLGLQLWQSLSRVFQRRFNT